MCRVEANELQDSQVDKEGKTWALFSEHPVLTPEVRHFHVSPLVRRAPQLMADHSMKGAPSIPVGPPHPSFSFPPSPSCRASLEP